MACTTSLQFESIVIVINNVGLPFLDITAIPSCIFCLKYPGDWGMLDGMFQQRPTERALAKDVKFNIWGIEAFRLAQADVTFELEAIWAARTPSARLKESSSHCSCTRGRMDKSIIL